MQKIELLPVLPPLDGSTITGPDKVAGLMANEARADREIFWVLHLNSHNQVIRKEMVAMGSHSIVYTNNALVIRGAVISGAPKAITVHNHPSGNLKPSKKDRDLWERLRLGFALVNIDLVDNMIISTGGYYSENEERKALGKKSRGR